MLWRWFLAFVPTVFIPLTVVLAVTSQFGFTLASFTAILILGQVYFVWAQLEVSLRQTVVETLQYEPQLKLKVEQTSGALMMGDRTVNRTGYHVKLSNDGAVGYNVIVSPKEDVKLAQGVDDKILGNLGKGETVELYTFGEGFVGSGVDFEIDYQNVMGEFGSVSFLKSPNSRDFWVSKTVREQGVLLRAIRDLFNLPKAIVMIRRAERRLEERKAASVS